MFGNYKVLSRYTRAQAIADGCLIDITNQFPECSKIYKYHVAVTARVGGGREAAPGSHPTPSGRLTKIQ